MWFNTFFPFFTVSDTLNKKFARYENNIEFQNTFMNLLNIALHTFKWENLPETCNERYLELNLILNGMACIVDDPEYGFLSLKASPVSNKLNMYGEPNRIYGYGWNGFMREYSCYMYGSGDYDVDSILCRDNKLCYPYIQYIIQASNRLMQTMRSIDVASKRLKLPYFIVCDESQKNSVKKILEDVDSNYDNIISSKSITPDMFKLFPTQVSGEALTTLWNNYNNLDSQIKTILGVDSIVNQDKKERLITDEANAMKSISNINVEMRLAERQKFCDTVNMIFGTDIKVSVNPNFITGDEKDERMEAFDGGETLE